ncbi:MAG: ABC transporter permease subunit [Synechococcaceae cyanobacterium SM2_3_2]|nr:ABC transporter permease subunit [Synechococcaceae cyanobacterium SM2_3_2]
MAHLFVAVDPSAFQFSGIHLSIALDWLRDPFQLLRIPFDDGVTTAIRFLVAHFRPLFQSVRVPINSLLQTFQQLLVGAPPSALLVFLTAVAWQLAGRRIGGLSFLGLSLIGFIGVWQQAMVSLSIVLTAVVVCVAIGIPVGVLSARSDRVEQVLRPLLDAMQTLPVFVYLVPVVMLFGIGEAPGVIATVIYALPPLIRLTNLGIRQVPEEVVEASLAFGSTPQQVLWETQIPLAMPTILAGVNQTVLFALGMSVVTSMIAVPGLGLLVLQGLNSLDVGMAATGGVSILAMAIILDRVTQSIGRIGFQRSWHQQGPVGLLYRLTRDQGSPSESPKSI